MNYAEACKRAANAEVNKKNKAEPSEKDPLNKLKLHPPKSLIHQVPISTETNSPTVPENQNSVANEQTDNEAAAYGSNVFYDCFSNGLGDWRDEFGDPHGLDMRKMFREFMLIPGGPHPKQAKLASFNAATELGLLASYAEHDQQLANSLGERLDWSRLNKHFLQVVPLLREYSNKHPLTVDKVRTDITKFPPLDLYFQADDVEWKGKLSVRYGRNMVPFVTVTLPCDGFLVSSPTVNGIPTIGQRNHPHRTFDNIRPTWDQIDPKKDGIVKAKIPDIIAFVTFFFSTRKSTEKLKIDVRSCVSEQRVDIEVTIPNVACLVIKFEVGLPVSKPPPNAASAKLWDEW